MTAAAPTPTGLRTLGARWAGSPLLRLIGKRLLLAVPITVGVSILTFWVLSFIPGNAARQMLGMEATEEQVRALQEQLGLNRPGYVRYLEWAQGALRGDLGASMTSGQPVSSVLLERFPVTLELVLLAFVVSLVLAIPVGMMSARRPGGTFDRVVMFVSMIGLSVANYVLALVLVLVFAVLLGVLPAIGYVPFLQDPAGNLTSLTLPTIAMAFPLFCFYTRFLRSDIVDQLHGQDYIDTARAKGAGPWRILVLHAFRNSSFGLLTLVGLNVSALVGGTVIIEQIFALPGIGQLLLQAITNRDTPVILAIVVIFAVVAVVANLVVDILYALLDPRIRHDSV